jgi:hypothetical protein
MKADKTAQDTDLSSIPGEFRENYRFLSELINCKHKNNSAAQCLEKVLEPRLCHIRGKLNRRQIRILNLFVKDLENSEPESLTPPVPAELEAAILVRKRSTWLPWEAEAIRKIERWREDLLCISQNWSAGFPASHSPRYLRRSAETSG